LLTVADKVAEPPPQNVVPMFEVGPLIVGRGLTVSVKFDV
jgi:hypothetical protein